ncbi:MAG: ATP-binding protein [Syntrophobacteraceae bacterium]
MCLNEFCEEMREIIEAIKIGSGRIWSLVSNLKDFARGDEGIAARPVQINEVIEKTLAIVGSQLRKQSYQVNMSLSDNLPSIYGHSQKLEQVMANLLLNAAHALPTKDEGKISVTTRYVGRLRSILIEIEDNGEGIKTEFMSRIFEPFYTTRRTKGGTEPGLSVSYGLVREHGGIIGALSRPGIGSRFTVYLPVEMQAGVRLSPIILCVDDDQGFLNMLRKIFIKVNTDVETLESAEAALGYLEEHPEVDIVLSDLFMPGMDGWEFLAKVKARSPLIAFILYTGQRDALQGKPKGVPFPDYFLEKPFTIQQLTRLVDSIGRQVL